MATGTVTFTIAAVNDAAPVLSPTVSVNRGTGESVVLSLTDLPTNPDGDSETLTFTNLGTPTAGGSVRIDADGNINYTPPSDTFTGTDTFSYSVSDGSGTDSSGTVTVQVEDFTPRDIMVEFSASQALSFGSAVTLSGQNLLGESVSQTGVASEDGGQVVFGNLLPGDYTIEVPAIPFFSGAESPQVFSVSSTADDGDAVVQSSMGRLLPQYLSIRDWLGSTPQQSVLVVVEPGASALVTEASESASTSIQNPSVALNEAGTSLTINGRNETDDGDVSASVLTTDADRVETRGEIGDLRLYRVDVEGTDFFTETPDDGANVSAEGESLADGTTDGLTVSAVAEGENVEAATSVAEVAAPTLKADCWRRILNRRVSPLLNRRRKW